MVTARLEGMSMYFLLRRKSWERDERTWCMIRQRREVRYRMDYWRWWEQEGIDLEGDQGSGSSGVGGGGAVRDG